MILRNKNLGRSLLGNSTFYGINESHPLIFNWQQGWSVEFKKVLLTTDMSGTFWLLLHESLKIDS